MADITDPRAIRFVNEQVRPLCERVRALKAEIDSLGPIWYGGMNTIIGSSAQNNIVDGREAEGISRLTANDVTNALAQFLTINPNAEIIAKPCVNPLRAS